MLCVNLKLGGGVAALQSEETAPSDFLRSSSPSLLAALPAAEYYPTNTEMSSFMFTYFIILYFYDRYIFYIYLKHKNI